MSNNTVAQMTRSEFQAMLQAVVETTVEEKLFEILGDPDQGLEIAEAVRDRLLRQQQAVTGGQYGRLFDEVVQELDLD